MFTTRPRLHPRSPWTCLLLFGYLLATSLGIVHAEEQDLEAKRNLAKYAPILATLMAATRLHSDEKPKWARESITSAGTPSIDRNNTTRH